MPDPLDPHATTARPTDARAAAGARPAPPGGAAGKPGAAPAFGPPAAAGEIGTLGPYRVLKQLGKGGMGIVYLAHDTRLSRHVALKVMLPEFVSDAPSQERFLREARAAAQISHSNVVTVYEADVLGSVPYMVMQFLQGYPLDEYLRKKGLPSVPQSIKVAQEAALGLAAAHELGLIHRDIKPANLWLEAPGGRVKVLDFGLARPVEAEGGTEVTKSGAVVGTPAYMSPEQARGGKVDHRTDLFSLGAVLFRLVTGRTPFERPSVMAVLLALSTEPEPQVLALNPQVPPALARLIHQLLSKNPDHRPRTAEEVAERLQAIGERPWADMPDLPSVSRPAVAPLVAALPASPEQSINVFRNIDATTNDPSVRPIARPLPKPKVKPKPKSNTAVWVAVGVVAVLAVAVIVAALATRGKKDKKADGPDGPPVATPVVAKASPLPPPVGKKDAPPRPADPDRRAAEYVLSVGGTVQVNFAQTDIRDPADLPKEAFALTKVWLRDNPAVTDAGLAACAECTGVVHLDLVRTRVSDAGLAHFKNCKDLLILDLDDARLIGDEGLKLFAEMTRLTSLWLGGTGVTDAGLAAFENCPSLNYIDVKKTRVTDAGLRRLKPSPFLSQLFVSNTVVGDRGVEPFAGSPRLALFDAANSRVTDAALPGFYACKQLQDVRLTGSRVTADGAANLAKALPNCRVVWLLD
jgi:serine/threonine protein kinase